MDIREMNFGEFIRNADVIGERVFLPLCRVLKDKVSQTILCDAIMAKGSAAMASVLLMPLFAGPHEGDMVSVAAALAGMEEDEFRRQPLAKALSPSILKDLECIVLSFSRMNETAKEYEEGRNKIAKMTAPGLSAYVCKVAAPAENLFSDSVVNEALKDMNTRIADDATIEEVFSIFSSTLAPVLTNQHHMKDTCTIINALQGQKADKLEQRNGLEVLCDLFCIFALDKDAVEIFSLAARHGANRLLVASYMYSPPSVDALEAILEDIERQEEWRRYIADMSCILVKCMYKDFSVPLYSDMINKGKKNYDNRSGQEIVQDIIQKRRNRKKNAGKAAQPHEQQA